MIIFVRRVISVRPSRAENEQNSAEKFGNHRKVGDPGSRV